METTVKADFTSTPRALALPARLATALGGAVRKAPLTLSLVLTFWVVGASTGSLLHGPRDSLRHVVLLESRPSLGHPLTWLASFLWSTNLNGYVWGTIALLTLGVFAEQHLGTGRYAVSLVTTHVLAGATLAASSLVLSQLHPGWTRAFLAIHYGGPTVGVVGATLAASASFRVLWRRRLRAGGLTLFATMALFDGGGVSVLLVAASVIGLVLGQLLVRAVARPSPVGSVHEARTLTSVIVGATALGPLLATVTPNPTGPFAVLGNLVAGVHGSAPRAVRKLCTEDPASAACAMSQLNLHPGIGVTLMACLPALLLLLAATGLRRGSRGAWIAALTLEGALAVVAVADYFLTMADAGTVLAMMSVTDEQPAILLTRLVLPCVVPLAAVVGVLVFGRDLFTVRPPAGYYRALSRRVAALVAASAAIYVAVGLTISGQWRTEPTVGSLLTDFPLRLAPAGLTLGTMPERLPTGPAAHLLFDWIGVAVWSGVCVLVSLGRKNRSTPTGSQNTAAQAILVKHGGPSLAWMGLWRGNQYWFSPAGTTYIPYRAVQGVALTIGDPIGPAAERSAAVKEFAQYCESMSTVPCFYSATAQLETVCRAAGWSSVEIAQETVLRLGSVAFTGKRFQDVRTALNRASREGMRTEWIDYGRASLSTVVQIRAISEEWVAQQQLPEMGFTLGGVDQLNDPHVRCSVVVDSAGSIHAVASWLPIYSAGAVTGWTLDFMRRRTDGFRHGTELLIAQAALDFQAEGYCELSLSGAPLARPEGADVPAGTAEAAASRPDPLDRLLDLVGTRLEPVYGFRSLLRFKAKFQPERRPLYLIYADAAALPAIGRAVARAYVPDASLGMLLRLFNRFTLRRGRESTIRSGAVAPARSSTTPGDGLDPGTGLLDPGTGLHDPTDRDEARTLTPTHP
ncbi:MAG: bifunctional lysylphosphatidylglycerol flippase/synthetase MprF [Cellulomonas sp.]